MNRLAIYDLGIAYATASGSGVYHAVYPFKTLELCLSAYNKVSEALLKGEPAVQLETADIVTTCNLRNVLFVVRNKDFEEFTHAEAKNN